MEIREGTMLNVTTASGEAVVMCALGRPTKGRDFPVVWVCSPEAYNEVRDNGTDPDGIPWPLDAVSVPEPA